jgi:hypothetical protein
MLFQLQRLCVVKGGKAVVSDEFARIRKEMLVCCLKVPSHCILEIPRKSITNLSQVPIQYVIISKPLIGNSL